MYIFTLKTNILTENRSVYDNDPNKSQLVVNAAPTWPTYYTQLDSCPNFVCLGGKGWATGSYFDYLNLYAMPSGDGYLKGGVAPETEGFQVYDTSTTTTNSESWKVQGTVQYKNDPEKKKDDDDDDGSEEEEGEEGGDDDIDDGLDLIADDDSDSAGREQSSSIAIGVSYSVATTVTDSTGTETNVLSIYGNQEYNTSAGTACPSGSCVSNYIGLNAISFSNDDIESSYYPVIWESPETYPTFYLISTPDNIHIKNYTSSNMFIVIKPKNAMIDSATPPP